jgi:3-phenylpropionate/trans-cinnamate dioxygenase ferredoxin reductase subunit
VETNLTPGYFWSDQYGVRLQFAGFVTAGDRTEIVDGAIEDRSFVATYQRGDELTGVVGFNRSRAFAKYRRQLVGVTSAA